MSGMMGMMEGMMPEGEPPMEGMPMAGEPPLEEAMEEGAEAGRGTDSLLGHLTPGEIVIPVDILSIPGVMESLSAMFEEAEIDINQFTVGNEANSINPETGNPEFFWKYIPGGKSIARNFFSAGDKWLGWESSNPKWEAEQLKKMSDKELARMQAEAKSEYAKIAAEMEENKRKVVKGIKREKIKFRVQAKNQQDKFNRQMKKIRGQDFGEKSSIAGAGAAPVSEEPVFSKRKFGRRRDLARKLTSGKYGGGRPS